MHQHCEFLEYINGEILRQNFIREEKMQKAYLLLTLVKRNKNGLDLV